MLRTFVDKPIQPWEMKDNPYYIETWVQEKEICDAFFRILTHKLEKLNNKYGGKIKNVPKAIIDAQTTEVRGSQDIMEQYISQRLIFEKGCELNLDSLVLDYISWFNKVDGSVQLYPKIIRDKFKTSKLDIISTNNRELLFNYRIFSE